MSDKEYEITGKRQKTWILVAVLAVVVMGLAYLLVTIG